MEKEMIMMQTLLNCEKELEKKYKVNLKQIKKDYKNKVERDTMVKNLNDQYLASKLALEKLIVAKKINVAVAVNA